VAIVFDIAASSVVGGASSLTYSHTVGVGTDTILIAQPAIVDAIAGTASISSVTYATVGMTLVPSSTQAFTLVGAYDVIVANYGLVAPATGANDVVLTASESCDGLYCGTQSWFGVHQTVSFGTAAIATGTSATPSVNVGSAVGEFVVANVLHVDDLGAFASADTERWELGGGTGLVVTGGASQTGSASVTMNWTGGAAAIEWGVSGVSLKPKAMNTRSWPLGVNIGMEWRMPV